MKIEINQRQLLNAVSSMSAIAGKSKAVQLFDNIEASVSPGKFTLRAMNIEAVLTRAIECETEGEGRFLVNCAQLLKYIATLPECKLTIEVGETEMAIRREKGSGKIAVSTAEMFPEQADSDETVNLKLPAEYLLTIVRDGSRFIANDTLRPHFSHIFVKVADGKMTGCATDTRVLYVNTFSVDSADDAEFYLNSAVFPILKSMLAPGGDCIVSVTSHNVQISCNGHELCFAVPLGKFPDVERVLPKNTACVMKTATADMKESVTRVMALTEGKSKLVKMSVSKLDAVVKCDDTGSQSSAKESFACECNGEIAIGFDGNYMSRVLASAGDTVSIGLNDATHPMLITSDHEPGMRIMLMPMMINEE